MSENRLLFHFWILGSILSRILECLIFLEVSIYLKVVVASENLKAAAYAQTLKFN